MISSVAENNKSTSRESRFRLKPISKLFCIALTFISMIGAIGSSDLPNKAVYAQVEGEGGGSYSDSDGDLISDQYDPCPDEKGTNCSPNTDGDNLPNYDDPCPDDPYDSCVTDQIAAQQALEGIPTQSGDDETSAGFGDQSTPEVAGGYIDPAEGQAKQIVEACKGASEGFLNCLINSIAIATGGVKEAICKESAQNQYINEMRECSTLPQTSTTKSKSAQGGVAGVSLGGESGTTYSLEPGSVEATCEKNYKNTEAEEYNKCITNYPNYEIQGLPTADQLKEVCEDYGIIKGYKCHNRAGEEYFEDEFRVRVTEDELYSEIDAKLAAKLAATCKEQPYLIDCQLLR